jgi:hypothetical protein
MQNDDDDDGVRFNNDNKFDFQLSEALVAERRLAKIFTSSKLEKVELKTESWIWERTGNFCVEFRQNGKPSGIAVTEADHWVQELKTMDDQTLCYLMFPIERLKELARKAFAEGRVSWEGGDGGRFSNILIPLDWLKPHGF